MCHRSGPTPTKKGTDLPSSLQFHSGFSFQYEDVENRDRGRREKVCMRRSVHPEVKDALGEVEIASAPETDDDGGRAALLTGFPSAARNLEPFRASSWRRLHLVLEEQRPVTSEAVIRVRFLARFPETFYVILTYYAGEFDYPSVLFAV